MLRNPPPLAAAAQDSLVRFGHPTRAEESNPLVTTAVSTLLKNRPDRIEFTFVNLGIQNIFVSTSRTVSSLNGILIPPNGGLTVLVVEDGEIVAWEWFAVAASGSMQAFVQEVVAE